MFSLVRAVGGAVIAGLGFVAGAELYEQLKKRIAGPCGDATPRRDGDGVVSQVGQPGTAGVVRSPDRQQDGTRDGGRRKKKKKR